jgi:[acyl-carrier-protein] S-malonyltransferase
MALFSDADGAAVRSGPDWLERIVSQVSAPVRWDACLRSMAALGVTALIELPPAGTLTGLARRALPGVSLLALKTPDQIPDARALAAGHGPRGHRDGTRALDGIEETDAHQPGADGHHPEWRLLVAPLAGTFRARAGGAAAMAPGSPVAAGAELGLIESRGDHRPVSPPFPGALIEWLVEDGDPVSAGQPIARLQPAVSEQRTV